MKEHIETVRKALAGSSKCFESLYVQSVEKQRVTAAVSANGYAALCNAALAALAKIEAEHERVAQERQDLEKALCDAWGVGRQLEQKCDALRAQLTDCQLESIPSRRHSDASKEPAQPPAPTLAEVRSELTDVLTGGNHLASTLIHYLGAGKGFPPYSANHDEARAVIKDALHYDLWCCWRSIMHMRESLLSRIPEGE